jgi:hypothetical protein
MFSWIQSINNIDKRTVRIMDELESLKAKLAVLGTKMDAVGQAISAESAEIKEGIQKLIDGLKAEPLDLSAVLIEAAALAGKADAMELAVKGLSDEVFPASPLPEPAPVEPVVEPVVEEDFVEEEEVVE